MTRLLTLDVFRGLTIALMILVNNPGNQTAYSWLCHSTWHGCTLADLVFPSFIFIVGVSLAFSLSKSLLLGAPLSSLILKVIKRASLIFLIGLLLNAFPYHFSFETIRVFGVLQRIAICYLFGAILFLTSRAQTQALIMLGLMIGYYLIMSDNLTQEGNLAAYIDRLIFSSAHLYGKNFDPEGLLSTVPALATMLLGNLTGIWLLSNHSQKMKVQLITLAGIFALISGWLWSFFFPINKHLWTSSFVLWTGGFAIILFALCYWLIEIKKCKKWAKPFEIFGINAIAAYVLQSFLSKLQELIHISRIDGSTVNLRLFITEFFYGRVSLPCASLMYAFSYMIFLLFICLLLYRNKIIIKI